MSCAWFNARGGPWGTDMNYHKIFRSTCLFMFLFCIPLWIISYSSEVIFGYFSGKACWVVIAPGRVAVYIEIMTPALGRSYYPPSTTGWRFRARNPVPDSFFYASLASPAPILGFYVGQEPRSITSSYFPLGRYRYCAYVPFWFFTLCFALPLLVIWLRARVKKHMSTPFPVVLPTQKDPT